MMQKDELLIFKQYDSDTNARARYFFHTAFNDPTMPADAPARQSIEVRAVALFSDAMTAPPPVARNLSDEVFEARVFAANRAPAAREVQSARGKRKMPARAHRLDSMVNTGSHGPPVDLDLQRAIEASLVDLS